MRNKYIHTLLTILVMVILQTKGTSQVHYYLMQGTVNPVSYSTAWTIDPTGASLISPPANFQVANAIWHFTNRSTVDLKGAILTNTTGASAATVIVESGFNLVLFNNLAKLTTKNLNLSSTSTLTIKNSIPTHTYNTIDANSTVIYSVVANVCATTYGNLNISANCTFTGNVSAAKLTIDSGKTLTLNSFGLTVNGSNGLFAGTGTIVGDNIAYIEIYGGNGGDNGTINFASGSNILDYIYLQMNTASDYLSLGTDLNIEMTSLGVFYHLLGSFNLNGHNLFIDANSDISFPSSITDGHIVGNTNSGIFIDGSVGVYSGSPFLFMDASNNTLGVLHLNSANTLEAGNTLNIADSLSVKGGGTFITNNNVTLTSNSALRGRVADLTNGTLTGNLTVQSFNAGGVTDWVVMGVSGIQGQTLSNWDGQFPMTCNGCTQPTTAVQPGGFASTIKWDESKPNGDPSAYVPMSNTDALTPGTGFWIFLGSGLTSTSDLSWNVTGAPVTGNVTIPLTNSGAANGDGWNLISNPYPSPIRWSSLWNGNPNVVNGIGIYSPDHGATTTWNGVVSSHPGGANDVIPMGQGFYVQATTGTNLTAQESNKVSFNTSANSLLRTNSDPNNPSFMRLKVEDNNNLKDYSVVLFEDNSTNTFDNRYDVRKISSAPGYIGYSGPWTKNTNISTKIGNDEYSINTIPYPISPSVIVPVIVRVYATSQVTISASDIENLPDHSCVLLRDKLTNITTDLTQGNYVCNIVDTTQAPRFELEFCGTSVPTSVKNIAAEQAEQVLINKDVNGVFVGFDFDTKTDATISVCNLLGQKLMNDKKVTTTKSVQYLNLNIDDQLIFVTVTTANGKTTKKFMYRNN